MSYIILFLNNFVGQYIQKMIFDNNLLLDILIKKEDIYDSYKDSFNEVYKIEEPMQIYF